MPEDNISKLLVPEKEDIIKLYTAVKSYPPIPESKNQITNDVYDELQQSMLKTFDIDKQTVYDRLNEFNKEQCGAIKMFLEYMQQYENELYESNNPKVCLERYWNKI